MAELSKSAKDKPIKRRSKHRDVGAVPTVFFHSCTTIIHRTRLDPTMDKVPVTADAMVRAMDWPKEKSDMMFHGEWLAVGTARLYDGLLP